MIKKTPSDINLMTTKEIISHLAKERYSSFICIGVLNSNNQETLEVNGCIEGKEVEVDTLVDELSRRLMHYYTNQN